eukprot:CAMPEP_0183489286 /NCGR_PEP_ID=MMETSP0370-20130417/181367_1 /TAXON_ID=268820 /ORGANISM="Peridinium aciculiferum, Strain PAER-2" /LENGTH=617 /DNA_ID=CAMNT_0025682619 /DNA_START=36 /DNA_END=1888 /DNA_ORIENTATION=-
MSKVAATEAPKVAIEAPHTLAPEKVLEHFGVKLDKGLTSKQVEENRAKYGSNELEEQEKKSLWELIWAQFEDLLVRILLLSALVSFALAFFDDKSQEEGWTAYVEPLVILLILGANAFVGVWQESNAEMALDALKKLQPDEASVLRDGNWKSIEAVGLVPGDLVEVKVGDAQKKLQPDEASVLRDGNWKSIEAVGLVPGDLVEVKVGDRVPADMRMLKLNTTTIRIEQSQLTGESEPVAKEIELIDNHDPEIQAKTNMLFSSTTISNGACVGIVVATGMQAEIGKIQAAVTDASKEEEDTPLQKKLDEFGELLAKVIAVICALVWIINYKHFFDPIHGSFLRGCIYYFKIAVALAVAAIPEGLPAVITTCLALGTRKMAKRNAIVRKLPSVETLGCTTVICSDKSDHDVLALGTRKMAKRNAIVRKLPSVETLGCTTVICSDKTGTLTTNEMCVQKFVLPATATSLKMHEVAGVSYAPVGAIKDLQYEWATNKGLKTFAKCGAMCNQARLSFDSIEGRYMRQGEPTEAAIMVLVEKLGCPDKATNDNCHQAAKRTTEDAMAFNNYWTKPCTKHATLEFTRERKSMSVLCSDPDNTGTNTLFVKGAPEGVLERCTTIM